MEFLSQIWHSALHSIPKLILILSSLISVFLVPLSLPGTWLILALCGLYSLLFNFNASADWKVLLILALIATLAEVLEFIVSFVGGKKLNVSNGALWSSLLGGLIGAFIGVPVFLIGSLLGLLLGTFLGAFIYEYSLHKSFSKAFTAAVAVFFSRLVASFLKTSLALGMWVYLIFKVV